MDHYKSIKKAYKALKAHRYLEAISLLQRINENRQDKYTLFLQAIALLLLNKFNDAEKTINYIKYIDPLYLPLKELEAFLFFKSALNAEEVILKYYELDEIGQNKKLYKKIIKKTQDTKNFSKLQKNILLFQSVIIPKPQKKYYLQNGKKERSYKYSNKSHNRMNNLNIKINKRIYVYVFVFIFIIIIFLLLKFNHNKLYNIFLKNHKTKNEKNIITLDDHKYSIIDKIVRKKTNIFYYDENKLKQDFENIQYLIKEKNYNNALILINKINNSNANLIVKEKLKLFESIIGNAKDRKISKLNYKDIVKSPYLFNGIMIQCTGKISNLEIVDNQYLFTLLVDYKNRDTFSGIFEVITENKNQELKNGDIVEITALFTDKVNNTNKIIIKALNINKK